MTECGNIAIEGVRQRRERCRWRLDRQPTHKRTRFGGLARAVGCEQRRLREPVAGAHISQQVFKRGNFGAFRFGFEHRLDDNNHIVGLPRNLVSTELRIGYVGWGALLVRVVDARRDRGENEQRASRWFACGNYRETGGGNLCN